MLLQLPVAPSVGGTREGAVLAEFEDGVCTSYPLPVDAYHWKALVSVAQKLENEITVLQARLAVYQGEAVARQRPLSLFDRHARQGAFVAHVQIRAA